MSAALHTRFASPVTLLREWAERPDRAALHEALFLGFTVDLPFLEKVAIPVARGLLGARTAVIGDAAQSLYDPVDVRLAGRGYLHGLAGCRGAFHPKVVLLIGEHACRLAVGSGNPTLSGWGGNDELWTVAETEDDASHALLADLADWLEELPSAVSLDPWSADHLREIAALLTQRHIEAPDGPPAGPQPRLLHNLRRPLVEQLPAGPVDELHAYAPFNDPAGEALRAVLDRLDPRETVLGLQPRWSSYDAAGIRAALDGRSARIRLLEESRTRHGKFVQWRIGDRLHALTGSPNLTRAALCSSTADGGNCELAVLAADTAALLPTEGGTTPVAGLHGRTIRPSPAGARTPVLLGAKTDSAGLHVSLARGEPVPVLISMSPDGSPGSWTPVGPVPPGERAASFPRPEVPGAAVRAGFVRADGSTAESPAVFVYSPVHCARRDSADTAPRLRYDYTAQQLFADERAARRFENDLLRLREFGVAAGPSRAAAATGTAPGATAVSGIDRWDAYLADCRRMIGVPLTGLAFGGLYLDLPQPPSSRWTVSVVTGADDGGLGGAPDDEEDAEDAEDADGDGTDEEDEGEEPGGVEPGTAAAVVPPDQRAHCRGWARRWVRSLRVPPGSPRDFAVGLLVAGLYVQLLAAGVWNEDDDGWRDGLAVLLAALTPAEPDHAPLPSELGERLDAVAAVLVALLAQDAGFTGGEHDVRAARTWRTVKDAVARAEPGQAADLMFRPDRARARVATWSEVERLVALAQDDDPYADVIEEFAAADLTAVHEDGVWQITGSFGNPLQVVTRAAARLGRHTAEGVLVQARGRQKWAFVAWDDPYLVLLNPPARVWRAYEIRPPATPESRFSGGDISAVPGRTGPPTPLAASPPEALRTILARAGLAYPELIRRLFADPG
ncbi:hypothetical protein [Actinacidiphila sp. ITFR-21]|uniref:hypothetical protein n=1 Tax=Actinacidiphila sp. ITFR-21 TaxID=3075199 RepID=UPI00288AB61D|nr:hypothetical protein [Streptomyces sp. ITFR-21]WNI14839.1 hypothetical protein RLT57_04335 [Streptomyces sp. ITFR-21]